MRFAGSPHPCVYVLGSEVSMRVTWLNSVQKWLKSENDRKTVLLWVIIIVMSIGIILSISGYSSAFQRSGALLIMFAAIFAAIDLQFVLGDVMKEPHIEMWRELKKKNELEMDQLENTSSPLSQTDQFYLEWRKKLCKQEALLLDTRMQIDILNRT